MKVRQGQRKLPRLRVVLAKLAGSGELVSRRSGSQAEAADDHGGEQ